MNYKTILSDLVSIDTHTAIDTLECVDFISSYLARYGLEQKIIYNPLKTRASIFAQIGKAENAIVLNGHMDTVPALPENWNFNPLTLTEHEGAFIGRGVCDMKGSISVALSMVPYFIKNKYNVGFVFTHDEETSGKGILETLDDKDVLNNLDKSQGVVVMEPTLRRVVSGHKNVASMNVNILGKPAHSSNPSLGIDSIYHATKIADLFYTTLESYKEEDEAFDVPYSTGLISKISGGQAVNIVPDYVQMKMSVRFMTVKSKDLFVDRYCNSIQIYVSENPGVKVDINVKASLPSLENNDMFFINKLDLPHAPNASYYTEAGRFSEKNITTVVFGPGDIAQAHTDNEFIKIKELEAFVENLKSITALSKKR